MNPIYRNIADFARKEIYQFIKLHNISLLSYSFETYFQAMKEKYNFKVLEHHIENDLISGITMIDSQGISISYEEDCIQERQNFTKCHELGHLVLKHNGNFFTESLAYKTTQELEADYFASIILMPDIVLLTKIFYQKKSYQEVMYDLSVSNKALEVRLTQLFQHYTDITYPKAKGLVTSYRAGTAAKQKLLTLLEVIKDNIISNYEKIQVAATDRLKLLLDKKDFITQKELPELKDQSFCQQVRRLFPNIKTWSKYERGKTLWYAWNSKKMTEKEVKRAVNFALYDLQNKND